MGKMALGYGSEFHLLRWLGRHRNEFDLRVKTLLGSDNINWIDFNFNKKSDIPDKELVGIEFLNNESQYNELSKSWVEEWPQTGNSMNWDLVGYINQNNNKTWILIEAKAHLGELQQNCKATSNDSINKIEKALSLAAKNNDIKILENKPWTKKYYQLANRIYFLNLLKRNKINAKLINIYFIGDLNSATRKSPQNEKDWISEIKLMKNYLSIDTNKL